MQRRRRSAALRTRTLFTCPARSTRCGTSTSSTWSSSLQISRRPAAPPLAHRLTPRPAHVSRPPPSASRLAASRAVAQVEKRLQKVAKDRSANPDEKSALEKLAATHAHAEAATGRGPPTAAASPGAWRWSPMACSTSGEGGGDCRLRARRHLRWTRARRRVSSI